MSKDKIEEYIKTHIDDESELFNEDEFSEVIYSNLEKNEDEGIE